MESFLSRETLDQLSSKGQGHCNHTLKDDAVMCGRAESSSGDGITPQGSDEGLLKGVTEKTNFGKKKEIRLKRPVPCFILAGQEAPGPTPGFGVWWTAGSKPVSFKGNFGQYTLFYLPRGGYNGGYDRIRA